MHQPTLEKNCIKFSYIFHTILYMRYLFKYILNYSLSPFLNTVFKKTRLFFRTPKYIKLKITYKLF